MEIYVLKSVPGFKDWPNSYKSKQYLYSGEYYLKILYLYHNIVSHTNIFGKYVREGRHAFLPPSFAGPGNGDQIFLKSVLWSGSYVAIFRPTHQKNYTFETWSVCLDIDDTTSPIKFNYVTWSSSYSRRWIIRTPIIRALDIPN